MRKLIDFNPVSGLVTTTTYEDGKHAVFYEQDVQAHLDLAARCRNERDQNFDKHDDIHHVAFIPDIVLNKMYFEDGVNPFLKENQKAVLRLIETKYPKCKTTTKRIV